MILLRRCRGHGSVWPVTHAFPPSLEISVIDRRNIDLWFQIGPKPAKAQAARDRVLANISSNTPHNVVRLVAHQGFETYARIATEIDSRGRLQVWPPVFADTLSMCHKKNLPGLILNRTLELFSEIEIKYSETRFLESHPDASVWRGAVVADRFEFTAAAAILTHRRSATTRKSSIARSITGGGHFTETDLLDLYLACQTDTMDRADNDPLIDLQADMAEFLDPAEPSADRTIWLVATEGDKPIGLLIPQIDRETRSGWIAYVGVTKSHRGKRVGTALIERCLADHDVPGLQFKAMVDLINDPSIKLHRSSGFADTFDRFITYRKPWSRAADDSAAAAPI